MVIEDIKNIKQGKNELRKFGITMGIFLGLLGALFWWRDKYYYIHILIISSAFLFLGIFTPVLLRPIQKVWMTLAILMGWFVTRVILSVLFFVVVTPIGLVARLVGKRFLDMELDKNKDSYWISKERVSLKKEDYEKQF